MCSEPGQDRAGAVFVSHGPVLNGVEYWCWEREDELQDCIREQTSYQQRLVGLDMREEERLDYVWGPGGPGASGACQEIEDAFSVHSCADGEEAGSHDLPDILRGSDQEDTEAERKSDKIEGGLEQKQQPDHDGQLWIRPDQFASSTHQAMRDTPLPITNANATAGINASCHALSAAENDFIAGSVESCGG